MFADSEAGENPVEADAGAEKVETLRDNAVNSCAKLSASVSVYFLTSSRWVKQLGATLVHSVVCRCSTVLPEIG